MYKIIRSNKALIVFSVLFFCTTAVSFSQNFRNSGFASSYPANSDGAVTASGETYHANLLTASHEFLPFNTIVKVTNLRNNKAVLVKINDRFQCRTNRLIDISRGAADEIGLFSGIAPKVKIEVIEWPKEESSNCPDLPCKENNL